MSEATADEYLTTVEAAAYLKLSRQYLEIARHRADGSGPAFIKLARAVRYRRSALDAWMNSHNRSGDEPPMKPRPTR
jgi:predicted DNA-binding transcriptional regulator AlpA